MGRDERHPSIHYSQNDRRQFGWHPVLPRILPVSGERLSVKGFLYFRGNDNVDLCIRCRITRRGIFTVLPALLVHGWPRRPLVHIVHQR